MPEISEEIAKVIKEFPTVFWGSFGFIVHSGITILIVARVIMSNRAVGATLSWISVVFLFPVLGPLVYLLIGELRLGRHRAQLVQSLSVAISERFSHLKRTDLTPNWHQIGDEYEMLSHAGERMLKVPSLAGNAYELFDDWEQTYDRMLQDIDGAQSNCDLEFYIWHHAGKVIEIGEALKRAATRGVVCRLLLDGVGSIQFLRSADAREMKAAGIQIQSALPAGLWRLLFVRFDLRMHRKILLIDDTIAWTGSLNLVDPRYFKEKAGVGQWIDAMTRITGPAVEAIAITFQQDWYIETRMTNRLLPDMTENSPIRKVGDVTIQVLPSGPANHVEAIERILISAIYTAKHEIVITSPYFVPSEALQTALISAAMRGVKVIVIIPYKVDSVLVHWASQSFLEELMQSGVFIMRFKGGLLHTKSVSCDSKVSLFGSLNMDPRSFRLNFELTLFMYNESFTRELRSLQQRYLNQSELIDRRAWAERSLAVRFTSKAARLLSPLL